MDFYGVSAASELFRVDDLLDFSNEEIFSSGSASTTTSAAAAVSADQFPPSHTPFPHGPSADNSSSADFTHDISFPIDDAADLEWLSQFVDDSFSDIPSNSLVGTVSREDPRFAGRARGKRSKAITVSNATSWTTSRMPEQDCGGRSKVKRETSGLPEEEGERRCTHCASEKTPQWRTGPMGPKTLCNACGVRYKSGRLVPEYRPAASPTFVLTQHSNSHRKVMELRRQKELMRQQQQQLQQQQQQQQVYRQRHDFEVC